MRLFVIFIAFLITAGNTAYPQARKRKSAKAVQVKSEEEIRAEERFNEILSATKDLFVIDSVVVDSNKVIEAIPFPKDYGRITTHTEFFNSKGQEGCYVFVNGFDDKCYYAEMSADSTTHLYTRQRLGGQWSEPYRLEGLGEDIINPNFPCMSSDGQTLYFSAQSPNDLGGYDIYVTHIDSDTGRCLEAENIGLPFNSWQDDIAYIEDDTDSIAWLVTNRRQPAGKTCIYTIAMSYERQNLGDTDMDEKEIRNRALLIRIRDTWPTPEKREQAMLRLEAMKQRPGATATDNGIAFVVNDRTVYTNESDFATPETRKLYSTIVKRKAKAKESADYLEELRTRYSKASAAEKRSLATEIIETEESLLTINESIENDIKNLRRKETEALGR